MANIAITINVDFTGVSYSPDVGGGCYFGHGINVSAGQAVFAVIEYVIR